METFAAAGVGNLLIVVAATNENSGTDNITGPAGYTLLGTYRQGTVDVNMAVFAKVAVGGETSATVTLSASQRCQTWFGEFSGYQITVDDFSTAGISSSVLAGDTGTVTPAANGSLFLGVVVVKNSPASGLIEGGGFTAGTVSNEAPGVTSAQKLMMGVYWDLNRSTAAREQPTWTTTAARYGGMALMLSPSAAPVGDAEVTVDRSNVLNPSTLLEIHSYLVQNTERGLPTGNAQHNQPALNNAINAMNAIAKGIANHTGFPTGNGFAQQDPTPYGGYTVGAQGGGSTLTVVDGTDFPAGGSSGFIAKVFATNGPGTTFTFTGVSGNTLTGCSGLPGSIPDGSPVALFNFTNNGFTGGGDRPLLFDNNTSYSVKEIFDLYTNSTRRTLVLAGASIWAHNQSTMFFPPRPAWMKTWAYTMAEICYQFAQNGTPITHVDVWVEYKGFANSVPGGSQGGSGTLQNGITGVLIPSDSGAVAALNANYPTGANSAGSNGYTLLHYAMMYNAVWDAFKNHSDSSVNTIKVMGSHQNFGATTDPNNHRYPLGTFDGTLQASGFRNGTVVPNGFDRNKLCYFLDYSTGIDALTLDYSIVDYGDNNNATEAYVYANYQNVRHIVRQVKSVLANRSGLSAGKRAVPLHFVEYYPDVNLARVAFQTVPGPTGGFSDLQQGVMEAQFLRCMLEEGIQFAYRWQPMGDGQGDGLGAGQTPLWNKASYHLSTQRAASNTARHPSAVVGESVPPAVPGALLPAYYFGKAVTDNFPPGTALYDASCDDASGKIWAVASTTRTVVVNGYNVPKNVLAEGSVHTVPAYGFVELDAEENLATFASVGASTSTFARVARRARTFSSAGTSTSAFSRVVTRARTLTSSGVGTSAFTLRRQRNAAWTSTGLSITFFLPMAIRGRSFTSTGVSATTFAPLRARTTAFTSAGASSTVFSAVRKRAAVVLSMGVGTSTFARVARRARTFTSAGSATTSFSGVPVVSVGVTEFLGGVPI